MEAAINAKLDMQSVDAGAGKEMLARLEVNEKAQAQLVRTEGLLAEKLDQEMQALVALQQRLSSLGVNPMSGSGSEASTSSSSSSSSSASTSIDTSIFIASGSSQAGQETVDLTSLKAEIASASITQDKSTKSMTLSLKITLTPSTSPPPPPQIERAILASQN